MKTHLKITPGGRFTLFIIKHEKFCSNIGLNDFNVDAYAIIKSKYTCKKNQTKASNFHNKSQDCVVSIIKTWSVNNTTEIKRKKIKYQSYGSL